jgi:deoxyribonuclease-4
MTKITKLQTQRFGAHLSVAGGLHLAFDAAVAAGCDCLQIFVKNQKQWTAKPLTDEAIRAYRAAQKRSGIRPVVAHASYLINLASPRQAQWDKSVAAMVDEIERCAALGVVGLVMHPGAHMGEGVDAGIARIVAGLDEIHRRTAGAKTRILLETTAGQGTSIGCDIEHLGRIINDVSEPARLGVCLDTCHLFAAGYDLRKPDEYERTLSLLRKHVTLRRIVCVHMNDSKGACGSRLDRHEHIGKGKMGLVGFRHVVNDHRLAHAAKILETPKGKDGRGVDLDKVNLRKLRRLIARAG